MKIIGHRGAAGLAPENTIKAVKAGIAAGADAIEFDIRLTSDGVFVLNHDATLERTVGSFQHIKDTSLAELETIETLDGELIPTLDEALRATGKTITIIEPKGSDWAEPLAEALKRHTANSRIRVIAFNHVQLIDFHNILPDVPCYALEQHSPLATMRLARATGLSGIDLSFWQLNPFTYSYARFMKLEVIIYTVDRALLMRLFNFFYPKVAITTNYPDVLKKIISKRK